MKKLVFSIAAIALIGTPAFAADMAVKAPPPAPAPVYSWTGWYAGVNAGASFGNVKTDFNVTPVILSGVNQFSSGFAFSNREYPDGFIGGGQIGYNWQYSPLIVVGLEADFQGAVEKESNNLSTPFSFDTHSIPGILTGSAATNYQTKIDWFGTVRGRIGYVWGNGQLLSYVTGGLAYGEVDLEGTNSVVVFPSGGGTLLASVTQTIGHSQVNAGWVVGGGTEGRLDFWGLRNWTWKIEGLYMDLGTLDATGVTSVAICNICAPGPQASGGQVTTHTHFTDTILRAGVNYQFH
jgi:outer membrane immunogenic protein